MKKTITFLFLLPSFISLFAQTFSSPESVEYDAANSRWIVGQNGSGQIHIYSPLSQTLTSFATGIASGPHGIEVLGNVVYCCDGPRIKGFDISTGTQVVNVNLGATFLNGLTSDGVKYLFATDFSGLRIYRFNTLNNTFNIMRTTTYTPNGIIYDGANNRCVFVCWGGTARIQAMSLADSTISTLYTTAFSNIDGITRDPAGYWYFTPWSNNSLQRIVPNFASAPVNVMSGLTSPADIDINAAGDSICIPNSGSANNVVCYTGIATGVKENISNSMSLFPNPAKSSFNIAFTEAVINGNISLYDVTGSEVKSVPFTGFRCTFDRGTLAAGVYFIELKNAEGTKVCMQKIILY